MIRAITIAVVGDVHEQWEEEDTMALHHLGVDLALFVGDFGNEGVEVVRRVAAVMIPKAVVLGNHDVWYTASKRNLKQCPYDPAQEDRLQQQLVALGEAHVGFGWLDFPNYELTIVGARPYSSGGSKWRYKRFYRERCGVRNFQDSCDRIVQSVQQAAYETIIFIGHNGPYGLGAAPHDPCGKDWKPVGGDYGDPDFADAIASARQLGKRIPLVTFGHMHHNLKHDRSRLRRRLVVDTAGTVYFNAANVPRVKQTEQSYHRQFSLVTLVAGQVQQVNLVWLEAGGNVVAQENLWHQKMCQV